MKKLLFAIGLFAALSMGRAVAAESQFFYSGDGYVAAGKTETLASDDGFDFAVSPFNTPSSIQITIDDFASNPSGPFTFFSVWLTAPAGSALSVGTYTGLGLAPFKSPGINVAGNNRSVNSVYGSSFNILAIDFDPFGVLSSLAVDFIQRDEGGSLGTTFGGLRYRSDVPLASPVPEPSSALLFLLGMAAVTVGLKRRRI